MYFKCFVQLHKLKMFSCSVNIRSLELWGFTKNNRSLRWTKRDSFIHINSFTKNAEEYGLFYIMLVGNDEEISLVLQPIYDFIHQKLTKNMDYFVCETSHEKCHLFHKNLHIWENICIKSVTFGPSQESVRVLMSRNMKSAQYMHDRCHSHIRSNTLSTEEYSFL